MTEMPEEGEEREEGTVTQLQTALEQLQMSDIRRMGPREQELPLKPLGQPKVLRAANL